MPNSVEVITEVVKFCHSVVSADQMKKSIENVRKMSCRNIEEI